MTTGFAHFDAAHWENFVAGTILICLDSEPSFRDMLGTEVRHCIGQPRQVELVSWGREEPLRTLAGNKRRSDLWMRFNDGLVLVEIKTHSGWSPASVEQQVLDQKKSRLFGEVVLDAVLLAPGLLLRRISNTIPKLSWHELFDRLDRLNCTSDVMRLARDHWSQNVEREFGLTKETTMMSFESLAMQTGCLVGLLQAAVNRLDGKVSAGTVWFSSFDGRPRRRTGWEWHGIAVRGRLRTVGDIYIGIYSYLKAPPTGETGRFMEAYPVGEEDTAIVSIPFNPASFSPDDLNAVLDAFVVAFVAAVATKTAV